MRTYRYVGPDAIKQRALKQPGGTEVDSAADVLGWGRSSGQLIRHGQILPATFVILPGDRLLIADRHSEHIACAGGADVVAAGELFFTLSGGDVVVDQASNQSTGYCPEPESWQAVARTLDRIGLAHPDGFTMECIFRRCPACGERNIIKDAWLHCAVCGAKLPTEWNF